jgi:2-polyprenyl-3-methyl-5-hydroxy-6-metoxy-1,4-benzoquinol methylase
MGVILSNFQEGKHLKINEIYDATNQCPVCLSKKERKILSAIQQDPEISFLICEDCCGVSASKMPTVEALREYYNNYYTGREEEEEKITFHNSDRFASHLAKLMMSTGANFENTITVLDLGGGDGSIALALARRLINDSGNNLRVDITVIDYIREDIIYRNNKINERIKFKILENINDINEKFNIFIASGVFEHIPELNGIIKKAFSLIKNSGFFYARTPFMIPFKRIIKELDLTYPAHVHQLGSCFWGRFAKQFRLNIKMIVSKPAITETVFSKDFVRTLASYVFKTPAYIELMLRGNKRENGLFYNFYGSWEVLFQVLFQKDDIS